MTPRRDQGRGLGPRAAALTVGLLLIALGSTRAAARARPADEPAHWARLVLPDRVRAGDDLRLVITPPAGVDEMEVLLSLDDGRSWPVRVTPTLAGGRQIVRWRVPNLPAAAARLRVRYRLDGVETEGPGSTAFAIRADARRGQDLDQFHEGNWWSGLMAGAPGPAPGLASESRTQIESLPNRLHAEAPNWASAPSRPDARTRPRAPDDLRETSPIREVLLAPEVPCALRN